MSFQIYSLLAQTEGERETFLEGCKKGVHITMSLGWYNQEMKFEIILPLLCFLLDPLTNRHCRAWSSMINLWKDSIVFHRFLSARPTCNYNYLELSKENVLRNMLSHWSCFTWKFFIWLKKILKVAIMP